MRHKLFIGICIISLSSFTSAAWAQSEATMYFMNSLPQVTYLNPAVTPRYKFSIGLPGSSVFGTYGNSGFTYNDFAKKEGNTVSVNLNDLYNAMGDKNYVTVGAQADIFRLSLKVNPRIYLTFNTTAKVYNSLMLPKEVAGVFVNGTLAYVNSVASLAPRMESLSYLETAVSSSYVVNKDLTVGLRVKILKGVTNLTTKSARIDLSLDDSYAITAQADGDVRTSGLKELVDNRDDLGSYFKDGWNDYLNNNGFAFDLGATYKVTDKLTAGLSLLDIGSIQWNHDQYGYRMDPARASYTFSGFDLERLLEGDQDYMDAEIDTIESRFTLQESRIRSYRTLLPAKVYLSAGYEWKRNLNLGLLFFGERFNDRFATAASVSITKDFGRRFTTSLSYTVTNRSFNNIGAGLSLNFAPLQLYVVGDNLLRAPIALLSDGELNSFVNSTQYFNIRAGLNIVFGWDKTQEKQPHPLKQR